MYNCNLVYFLRYIIIILIITIIITIIIILRDMRLINVPPRPPARGTADHHQPPLTRVVVTSPTMHCHDSAIPFLSTRIEYCLGYYSSQLVGFSASY